MCLYSFQLVANGLARYRPLFSLGGVSLLFVDTCAIVQCYECGGGEQYTPCHSEVRIHLLSRVVYGWLLSLCVFQHLQEYTVDRFGSVFSVSGQSVGVHAKGVHVLAVAYKVFDFPGGQGLNHGNKSVAQFV